MGFSRVALPAVLADALGPFSRRGLGMVTTETMVAGLANDEFFLEYLPSVSLVDGRCTGGEALARWQRPGGVVSPDAFIPVAEKTPVAGLITYWVLDTVMRELGSWLREHGDARLSINVPPEIVGRGGLKYVADKNGLAELASQIIVEITERGLPDPMAVAAINDLPRYMPARVALDDVTFVGAANLAVLARCHVGIVKLDRSLVAQIAPDAPVPAWVRTMGALVRDSELHAIAEGVETEYQALTLRDAGIEEAQGFHFSRPLRAPDFIAFHRDNQGGPAPLPGE